MSESDALIRLTKAWIQRKMSLVKQMNVKKESVLLVEYGVRHVMCSWAVGSFKFALTFCVFKWLSKRNYLCPLTLLGYFDFQRLYITVKGK